MRIRLKFGLVEISSVVLIPALLSHVASSQSLPIISFARPAWTSEASFSQLASARELANGNVIVADNEDVQLYLIGPNGQTVASIGRKGSGPAEYLAPIRLIALANDSTLVVDVEARRYLLIDGRGKVVGTHRFPELLGEDVGQVRGADPSGRLYFRYHKGGPNPDVPTPETIVRWQRGREHFDTVATITVQHPKPALFTIERSENKTTVGRVNVRFAPVDDWIVAPSGRLAIIHAAPYRVDWVEKNGKLNAGSPVTYTPVVVTEADRKRAEPKGPPFVRTYAKVKSAFMNESSATDDRDNVWVPRYEAAGAASRRWDVFSATGKHLGIVPLSANRTLLTITKRNAYVVRTDDDGLKWLERYAR